jgi:hypothetical protein
MNSGVIVKSSWNAGEDAGIALSSTRIYTRRIPFSALPGDLPLKRFLNNPYEGEKKGGILMSIKKVEKKMRGTCKCKVSC